MPVVMEQWQHEQDFENVEDHHHHQPDHHHPFDPGVLTNLFIFLKPG